MPAATTPPRRRSYAAGLGTTLTIGIGATILHQTLRGTTGGNELVLWSIALAATWLAGAVLLILLLPPAQSGTRWGDRLHARNRPILFALIVGVLFAAVSLAGALIIREIPVLGNDVTATTARVGDSPILVFVIALITGATEELFFRVGIARRVPGKWAVPASTLIYGAVTLASGNLPLTLAALLLGATSALTLTATGKWYTPLIVHALWTVALIGVLPNL